MDKENRRGHSKGKRKKGFQIRRKKADRATGAIRSAASGKKGIRQKESKTCSNFYKGAEGRKQFIVR